MHDEDALKSWECRVCLSEGIVQKAHLVGDPANGLSPCSCMLTAAGLCKLMTERLRSAAVSLSLIQTLGKFRYFSLSVVLG